MPLVNAKCTNCGAELQVDNTKDAAICQYCGSAYIVEKAINNYNTVNNIHAGVVNIYGGNSADFVIRGGVLEKYNGASTHVVIPDSVRCIGEKAFMDTYIESVSIPDSVKSIESEAFFNCRELREIRIPDSVKSIEPRAFFNCRELREIRIPDGVVEIKDYMFGECTSLSSVVLPNELTRICDSAFKYCKNLASINIPKSIEYIAGYDCFDGCILSEEAFKGCCNLVNVNFEDLETAERLCRHFPFSPIAREKSAEAEKRRVKEEKESWRRAGVCDLCGGNFKGLITKKCSKCGKNKQY